MSNERQRQTYYGALNLLTQEFHLYEAPTGNGVNTVAYIRWCQTLYPDKKLLFLWDGASYHRGEDMQKFLAQENAGVPEAEWKVTCVRFAPNAPDPAILGREEEGCGGAEKNQQHACRVSSRGYCRREQVGRRG